MASTPHQGNSLKRKREKLTWPDRASEKFYLGDIWESYSSQLELYFAENSIPDDKKVAILLSVVSPPMYEVLRDWCHPEVPQLKTYAQLSRVLESHYSRQASVMKDRIKFHEAAQAGDESVNKWLDRVIRLAVFCEFGKQLDAILRDKFVSGLTDQRIVARLCRENDMGILSMRHMVDLATGMENSEQKPPKKTRSRITEIPDIPDEILTEIVLHLNPRERLPLGYSCQKFNSLVFGDKKLLRDLDFSKEGHLTSVSDIQEYFNNESTREHIRQVNMRNVKCMRPDLLNDTIGRATNLVGVHIHGIAFRDIWQLGSFLNQLPHLRRLSIDWQLTKEIDLQTVVGARHRDFSLKESDILLCKKVLQKPFSRLTYLSVHVELDLLRLFIISLQLCCELQELRIELEPIEVEEPDPINYTEVRFEELEKLPNLEVVEYWGPLALEIERRFVHMLPDPQRWTEFQMSRSPHPYRFYLEKDISVCEELMGGDWMKKVPNPEWKSLNLGWILFPELLLDQVLRITHENVPEKFCCLTTFSKSERCLLNIKDIRRLLKDPGHQVSDLHMNHDIERSCDVHLIASAFPGLTGLYLSNITRNKVSTRNEPHVERRLRRKGQYVVPEEQDDSLNLDSSFKLLVDHTPNVNHLTLHATSIQGKDRCWDLDALYLIPGWTKLETLRLFFIPIEHGDFLIEIGKRCKNLRQLMLNYMGGSAGCYRRGLFQMLPHCRSLKQFIIEQHDVGQVSKVFNQLSNNSELTEVRVKIGAINDTIDDLLSSIEQLLRRCSKLTIFTCEMNYTTSDDHDQLSSAMQRLNGEFTRIKLEVQVDSFEGDFETFKLGTIHKDTVTPTSYSSYADRRPNFP